MALFHVFNIEKLEKRINELERKSLCVSDMTYCEDCETWYEGSEVRHMVEHLDQWHNERAMELIKKDIIPN